MYREESDSYHRKLLQIMLLPKKAKQKDKGYKLFNTRFFIWLLKVIFFFLSWKTRYLQDGVLKITISEDIINFLLGLSLGYRYVAFRSLEFHSKSNIMHHLDLGWMSENWFLKWFSK